MGMQTELIQVASRFGVTTHNPLYRQEGGSAKLLIILPGRGYTVDFPALYYLRSVAQQAGYDVLCVEYGFQAAHTDFGFHQVPDLVADVEATVRPVLQRGYTQVCVAGKSLGTPLAANLARSISDAAVSLILLTPVGDSTQHLDGLRTLVVIGTADPAYEPQTEAAYAGHSDVTWHTLDGLDHGFEVAGHWRESLAAMQQVIEPCAAFLGAVS